MRGGLKTCKDCFVPRPWRKPHPLPGVLQSTSCRPIIMKRNTRSIAFSGQFLGRVSWLNGPSGAALSITGRIPLLNGHGWDKIQSWGPSCDLLRGVSPPFEKSADACSGDGRSTARRPNPSPNARDMVEPRQRTETSPNTREGAPYPAGHLKN